MQDSFYPLTAQMLTKTYRFGLKMQLARRVYSTVPVGYFGEEFAADVASEGGVIMLAENQQIYATDKPRRVLKSLMRRIDAQRVITLKNTKNGTVDVLEEVSVDYEDDFFALDFEEFAEWRYYIIWAQRYAKSWSW